MNTLKLLALGTLAFFAVATPAQAQTEVAPQSEESSLDPAQTDVSQTVEQLPPDLAEPLEVGQPEANEFFAPSPRQLPVETQTGSTVGSERLIEPPPGTQTPGQLTPERRLSIPIQ
jgi:hypothetical protein